MTEIRAVVVDLITLFVTQEWRRESRAPAQVYSATDGNKRDNTQTFTSYNINYYHGYTLVVRQMTFFLYK